MYFQYLHHKYNIDTIPYSYEILGDIEDDYYNNFIRIDMGKGHLFLHSSPIAFTNYNILNGFTDTYTQDVFSMLPKQDTYWDETYTSFQMQSQSLLSVIFRYLPIKIAYYFLIALVIAFILTNTFRKQRVIPVFTPPQNTSIELVSSVAELYIHQKDHKNLSDKIIRHFYDYIHQQYYLSPSVLNDRFVEKLSAKSGKSIGDIKELVAGIQKVKNSNNVYDSDLLELCGIIEDFKNK
jgi:hypothetical protein